MARSDDPVPHPGWLNVAGPRRSRDTMNVSFGIACGLTGAASSGLVDSCATVASRRVGTLATSTGMQVAAVIPLVALWAVTGARIPTNGALITQAVFVGLISAAGYLVTYQAFRLGPLTVVGPAVSACGGLSVVLAVIILGESLRPLQIWGVTAATIGVALSGVVLDRRLRPRRLVGRGVPFAVGALVIWAVVIVGLAAPIRGIGWLATLTISRLASTAVLVLAGGVSIVLSRQEQRRQSAETADIGDHARHVHADRPVWDERWPTGSRCRALVPPDLTAVVLVVAMGWLDVFGSAVWSIGLASTAAWLVGITGSLGPIVSMTFGLLVLGERLRPNQWLGVAIVLSSIILIAAS